MMVQGTWCVEYSDGTFLSQYGADGSETPYRAIDWSRVTQLKLESDLVAQTFAIIHPPAGHRLALQGRVLSNLPSDVEDTEDHVRRVMMFMLVTYRNDVEINPADYTTYEQACVHVLYWLPNGVIHNCPHYNCKDVAEFISGEIHGIGGRTLMPDTHQTVSGITAAIS